MNTTPEPQHSVELVRSHARVFDTKIQAVIGTTLDGRIVYWNETATRIYGWRAEEALGRDVLDVTPALISREAASAIMQRLRAGRTWSGDFRVRRRDGQDFLAHVQDVPVPDERGELIGIVGISTPVVR